MENQKIKVYTIGYFPFIMGGNVHQPISCEVEAKGPFELGDGYKGYLVQHPNGDTYVAEESSGGFVGPNLKLVRKDIKEGDKSIMAKQVVDAVLDSLTARIMPANEFWEMLKKRKEDD
jgi:hypothetical protein